MAAPSRFKTADTASSIMAHLQKEKDSLVNVHDEEQDSLNSVADINFDFDPNSDAIKRVRWKIDRRLVPLLALMYLCSYLDRANIGNAKVAGMEEDLHLQAGEFNTALSVFYIGYVIGEVPANMALKRFGPRKWIPFVMFLWGTVMISMAAVKSASTLYIARFFLGLAESGYAPGPVFVISLWYVRNEQAIRIGIFFSAATVAGAFGGLLAYGIAHLDGVRGLAGWQWIFILEGIPTLVVCIIAFFILPDFPSTSTFLTLKEKELTVKRLRIDAGPAVETKFSWVQFWSAWKDWKVHVHMFIGFVQSVPFAALGVFIPSIVQGFGFDQVTTQIMTVPLYAVACFFTILTAYSSDKHKERGIHGATSTLMAALGYLLLVLTRNSSTAARYISLMICTAGMYSFVPIMLSWPAVNIGGHTKRGVAIALIISVSQIGSAVGGQLYRNDDAPLYKRGHTISACLMIMTNLMVLLLKFLLIRENRRRNRLLPEEFAEESKGSELADRHPSYRYYT